MDWIGHLLRLRGALLGALLTGAWAYSILKYPGISIPNIAYFWKKCRKRRKQERAKRNWGRKRKSSVIQSLSQMQDRQHLKYLCVWNWNHLIPKFVFKLLNTVFLLLFLLDKRYIYIYIYMKYNIYIMQTCRFFQQRLMWKRPAARFLYIYYESI